MWHASQDFRFNTRLMRVDVENQWTAIWEYGGVGCCWVGDKFLAITKKCFEVGGYVQRWKMRLAVTENGGHAVGTTAVWRVAAPAAKAKFY